MFYLLLQYLSGTSLIDAVAIKHEKKLTSKSCAIQIKEKNYIISIKLEGVQHFQTKTEIPLKSLI